jgi:hypothetical protein
LTYFLIMYNKHKKLFDQNPKLLIIDFTYKTNRFNMLLFNMINITLTYKSFFAGSCFLPLEIEDSFIWCFTRIKIDCDWRGTCYLKI